MFVFTRVHPLQGAFGSNIEQTPTGSRFPIAIAPSTVDTAPAASRFPVATPGVPAPVCPTCKSCPPQRDCPDCPTCAPCEPGFQRSCYSPARWPWVLGTAAGGIVTLGLIVSALKSRKK